MNKYQEALDYVNKSVCTALNCLGIEDNKTIENLNILQELVDKETPAKPIKFDEIDNEIYKCPNCDEEIRSINRWVLDNYPYHVDSGKTNYCAECGQKLDWSDKYNG